MKSKRILIGAIAVAALVLSSLTTPAAQGAPGNAVTTWNQIAVATLVGLPGPAGGAPPAAQVHVAMVQGAVYDAVNAITPKHYRPYLLHRRFAANASKDAAVATAAYGVLRNIVSTVPKFDPAPRAERGGVDIDPRLDLGARKYAKAEEARAPSAGLDLGPMPGCMRFHGDKRGDSGSGNCDT